MEVVDARCCGVDVHPAQGVAWLIPPGSDGRVQQEIRTFGTMTDARLALVRERSRDVQRRQPPLEGAHSQLGAVASDILGKSGREILAGLVGGRTDAAGLADRATGQLRAQLPALERTVVGRFAAQQRLLVARQVRHRDDLDGLIAEVRAQRTERLRPCAEAITRLDGIPEVGRTTAAVRVAAIGTDLTRVPTARHRAAWAALCPGKHERAGHQPAGKTRTGNRARRTALVEAAQAAGRARATDLSAQHHRLAARRGKQTATVAHSILIIADHLLKDGGTDDDLGPACFDRRNRDALERRLVSRLDARGYTVGVVTVA